jgi:uncharacterized protein (TIGR02757 family)
MKLNASQVECLKLRLDAILAQPALINHARDKDPIGLVYPYRDKLDREVVAFIVSTLSYGRQSYFRPILYKILEGLSEKPSLYIVNTPEKELEANIRDFQYRFNNKQDMIDLIKSIRNIYCTGNTLESVFKKYFNRNIREAASGLVGELVSVHKVPSIGLKYLIPNPDKGSACKRLNMFLRWMVRKDEIDLGIWEGIPTESLIIPLDTHIAKASRVLGLTTRKDASWQTAVDITESLSNLDSKDPVKYDFALCTSGILKAII